MAPKRAAAIRCCSSFFVPIFTHSSLQNPPRFNHFQRGFLRERRINYPINSPKISPSKGYSSSKNSQFSPQKSPQKGGILRVKRTQTFPLSPPKPPPGLVAKDGVIGNEIVLVLAENKRFLRWKLLTRNYPPEKGKNDWMFAEKLNGYFGCRRRPHLGQYQENWLGNERVLRSAKGSVYCRENVWIFFGLNKRAKQEKKLQKLKFWSLNWCEKVSPYNRQMDKNQRQSVHHKKDANIVTPNNSIFSEILRVDFELFWDFAGQKHQNLRIIPSGPENLMVIQRN